jgi:ABC-type antimicrobial peptide transport system permease subunit
MLSNIGGFMGLILAAIVSRFFNVGKILNFMYINMQTTQSSLSWQAALLSLALASIVGGLFGIYPAYQAAQYSPVESLRD